MRQYGLTVEQYDIMLVAQSGRCNVCTIPMLKPNVDHCHETGRVRGLLCWSCNIAIGYLKTPDNCRSAATHLENLS